MRQRYLGYARARFAIGYAVPMDPFRSHKHTAHHTHTPHINTPYPDVLKKLALIVLISVSPGSRYRCNRLGEV